MAEAVYGDFIGEFLAVAEVPFGEEVVLDPNDLVDGAHEAEFAAIGELGMAH